MKLSTLRFSNFQSFGFDPTEINLEDITYLIGPNGSGKTAALQGLCRMFAIDPSLRRVKRSDFHVPIDEKEPPQERSLWIEADFMFSELAEEDDGSTVAPHFAHMRLDELSGVPRIRFRLDASLGPDGDIEEKLLYVLEVNADGSPLNMAQVPRSERNHIHVHYLPAQRDPSDHIAYSTNALLGRLLRAITWDSERPKIRDLTDAISSSLAKNPAVDSISSSIRETWSALHKGKYFNDPQITFVASEIEALLRHMSVSFGPGHDEGLVDFTRLSDGQKSMLYLSLVLSSQQIGRAVLKDENKAFDIDKLRPPVFTVVALEEPENSLSPYYLGRIINALSKMANNEDAQAVIATHAPSMLRRVAPENIRYMRLTESRKTKVTHIQLPKDTDEAHKFVREAVQAFPEVYFSRLVVLGEGDSEEIVLPRILQAKGAPVDESAVTIAPLGGRHVNHFWRLLESLEIPYLTLLDLDVARYQAGWGRFKYANDQISHYQPSKVLPKDHGIPEWNSDEYDVRKYPGYLKEFEQRGVYFSSPMDLDFSMIQAYPDAYGVVEEAPDTSTIVAVLGKSHCKPDQYTDSEKKLFHTYHQRFKLGSKPAAHIDALAQLSDEELLEKIPNSLSSLADAVIAKFSEIPE